MEFTKEQIKTISNSPGIYLITNKINGKNYVGQAIDLRKRLRQHLNTIENKTRLQHVLLYKAINKYNLENFELKIIYIINKKYPKDILKRGLDKLEKLFIKKYDSYGVNGYNQTIGGDAGVLGLKMTEDQKEKISQNSKKLATDGRYKIYCLNIHTNEVIKSSNMTELSKIINISASIIRDSKCHKRILKETYYLSNSENILEEYEKFTNSRYSGNNRCGTQNDSYLIEYYNYLINLNKKVKINEVAENLGLNRDTILKRNKKLREMGYTLPFDSHNKISYVEVLNVNTKEISNLTIQEIADKFNISIDSARKQVKRDNIYKKTYKFNIIYES